MHVQNELPREILLHIFVTLLQNNEIILIHEYLVVGNK